MNEQTKSRIMALIAERMADFPADSNLTFDEIAMEIAFKMIESADLGEFDDKKRQLLDEMQEICVLHSA